MTPNPVDLVRKLFRLFADGKIEETYPLMSDDVRLSEPGDATLLPWAGEFEGHDGLTRFYTGLETALDSVRIDPDAMEFYEVEGGRVLALGRELGVSAATGAEYESSSAWLWEVRDGRIVRMRAFHDTWAMTEALGAT